VAANFVNGEMDVVDKLVEAANYEGVAVETSADKVVRVVNSAADVAVTNVAECVAQMVNVVLVLAFDAVAIAIVIENVDVAVDTVDTASTESCSAIRVAFLGG